MIVADDVGGGVGGDGDDEDDDDSKNIDQVWLHSQTRHSLYLDATEVYVVLMAKIRWYHFIFCYHGCLQRDRKREEGSAKGSQ